jgi:hypothetical protein
MNYNLVLLYNKNLYVICKRYLVKLINVYSFYVYVFWYINFLSANTKLKRGKLRFDAFIAQVIGIYPKLLGYSVINYSYFSGVEIFRRVFLKSSVLLKYYEVLILKYTFFSKTNKKLRYLNSKKFIRLNF